MAVAEVKPGPALYVHGVFVANDPTGLNQARFEEVARKINEAAPDPIPQDASVETESQGYALEAIWQFVPELKPREDNLTVLTPAQLEKLLRRLEWVPPPEWQECKARMHPALGAPYGDAPVDMVLHCPACGQQHIDAPEEHWNREFLYGWENPPHRSHLCHGCGHIWRPADVPTNGVAAVKTKGKGDHAAVPTIDLQRLAWSQMAQAVRESSWIPHEHYSVDDWVRDACKFLRSGKGLPGEDDNGGLLDFLEGQAKASRTGVSLTYDKPEGFRFMRFHFTTDFHPTLRAAIEAGMKEANHG